MEIINIEARTFEAMVSRFEQFVRRIDSLCGHKDRELQKWLDNQNVCQILNISKRTLQTYRDNSTLPYSQINHKMYYKPGDVQKVMQLIKNKQYGK
ncbi:DNA-binding protein [Bacteroidia bacterium]|nr:DNA-binding protein [Bacteroidia bacterium]